MCFILNIFLQQVVDKDGPVLIIPKVGMSFASENGAYEMYNTYAGIIGFSIRKSVIKRRADKTIYSKVIVCSSQGQCRNGIIKCHYKDRFQSSGKV
jgi:hypothetical protein